jgi:hypothetical protein
MPSYLSALVRTAVAAAAAGQQRVCTDALDVLVLALAVANYTDALALIETDDWFAAIRALLTCADGLVNSVCARTRTLL